MATMTFSPSFFEAYTHDVDGTCSLCGGVVGKDNVIGCKDNVRICLSCAGLLGEIKKEKDAEMRNKAVELMNEMWTPNSKMHCEAIYDAIYAGKIYVAKAGD